MHDVMMMVGICIRSLRNGLNFLLALFIGHSSAYIVDMQYMRVRMHAYVSTEGKQNVHISLDK